MKPIPKLLLGIGAFIASIINAAAGRQFMPAWLSTVVAFALGWYIGHRLTVLHGYEQDAADLRRVDRWDSFDVERYVMRRTFR